MPLNHRSPYGLVGFDARLTLPGAADLIEVPPGGSTAAPLLF